MYFTSGSDRAFEQLMQTRPGTDHFDNSEAGAPEDCGTCRFYRPHWKYQFCVYEENIRLFLQLFSLPLSSPASRFLPLVHGDMAPPYISPPVVGK